MRLYIFNNHKLKHVVCVTPEAKHPYSKYEFSRLYEIVEKKLITVHAADKEMEKRKGVLWSYTKQRLKDLKGIEHQSWHDDDAGITYKHATANKTSERLCQVDYVIDRATGWMAVVKNCDIFRELGTHGHGNGSAHVGDGDPAYRTYSKVARYFWGEAHDTAGILYKYSGLTPWVTDGESERRHSNVLPKMLGGFYSDTSCIQKDDILGLVAVATRLSNKMRAIVTYEWPVFLLSGGYGKLYDGKSRPAEVDTALKVMCGKESKPDWVKGTFEALGDKAGKVPASGEVRKGAEGYFEELGRYGVMLHRLNKDMKSLVTYPNIDLAKFDYTTWQVAAQGLLGLASGFLSIVSMAGKIVSNLATLAPNAVVGAVAGDIVGGVADNIKGGIDNQIVSLRTAGYSDIKSLIIMTAEFVRLIYLAYLHHLQTWGCPEVAYLDKEKLKDKIKKLEETKYEPFDIKNHLVVKEP